MGQAEIGDPKVSASINHQVRRLNVPVHHAHLVRMLQRIGRASFRYGVEEQAALMGVAGVALKVMSQRARVKFILTRVAKALMEVNEETCIEVEETPEGFVFVDMFCALCYGRQAEEPVCHLLVGSIDEAVKWATGKEYEVREIECRAMGGDACRFLVVVN